MEESDKLENRMDCIEEDDKGYSVFQMQNEEGARWTCRRGNLKGLIERYSTKNNSN